MIKQLAKVAMVGYWSDFIATWIEIDVLLLHAL